MSPVVAFGINARRESGFETTAKKSALWDLAEDLSQKRFRFISAAGLESMASWGTEHRQSAHSHQENLGTLRAGSPLIRHSG
jgi:hypothetical protein